MTSSQAKDGNRAYYDPGMPAPEIPKRKTPGFMKALWLLALLLLGGMAYSFWRISTVPSPRLDVPQSQTTEPANKS